MDGGSILDTIGTDLIGIISPVSICMLLVVLLISTLSAPSSLLPPPPPITTAANLIYSETPSDSLSTKLTGAALNAVVFILLIAAVTFLLVLLYYYNFTNFLKNYMRLSAFLILATMGGSIFVSLIVRFNVPVDVATFGVCLFNFAVVGVVAVFGRGVPIIVSQGYTVGLGVITASWFTRLPEWTTWMLLVALAVYDLVAVLAPGGPLRMLVEMAQSRDDELPALVYEARPTVSTRAGRGSGLRMLVGGVSDNGSVELQNFNRNGGEIDEEEVGERSPLVQNSRVSDVEQRGEMLHLVQNSSMEEERSPTLVDEEEDEPESDMTRGIKLGLGDFVFYSVLVGRAAMYDLMTVYACYLAIISGLACTLILLSVFRRALPALPISIALGVIFYFLTRLLMEPFVVQISTHLLMF